MKVIQRGITLLSLAVVLFCMTACTGQEKAEKSDTSYIAKFLDFPESVTGISRLLIKDDLAYMCCTEEKGISYLASVTPDDGKFQKLSLEIEDAITLLDLAFDAEGNIWIICADDAGRYSLRNFDKNGEVFQTVDLTELLGAKTVSVSDRQLFLSIDAEGNICIAEKYGKTSVYMFSDRGQYLFSLSYEGNLLSTITTARGQIGVCASSADRINYDLLMIDMENRDWGAEKIHLKGAAGVYGGNSSSFYRLDSSGLYGYQPGFQEGEKLFKWSDVGLSTSDVHLGELSDGRFIAVAASPNQTNNLSYEMAVISQGTDDRTVLSMVSLTARPSIVQAVSDFNKTNSRYRVELTEYFPYEQNISDEEWENAILNLNARIISGDIPDILDMSGLSVQIYHSKGLLENLYPYMENDSSFHMDDYFENVFQALSIDGELPYLTNGVAVSTMFARSDIMEGRAGWTPQDLEDILNAYGFNSVNNFTGNYFLKTTLQADSRFVDWASGECGFDSHEFIKLLEFAKKIQNGDEHGFGGETLSGSYVAAYDTVYSIFQIAKYRDYYQGDVRMPGLPGNDGSYYVIRPEVKIGISSSSNQKDGAWEFVRTLLSEEHQKSCYYFPVHKRAFETVMQAAVEGKSIWTWLYENGRVEAEDIALAKQLLDHADCVENDNQTLERIYLEEAQEYFSGVKSAKEAAEVIQNRASLYIREQL